MTRIDRRTFIRQSIRTAVATSAVGCLPALDLLALPAISTEFETLLAQGQQALEVTITSAFPLEADEIQLLESKLKTRYAGKTIRVETAVDQSLIGGFEIRSSDTVIDATVRGRLSKIAESLTA